MKSKLARIVTILLLVISMCGNSFTAFAEELLPETVDADSAYAAEETDGQEASDGTCVAEQADLTSEDGAERAEEAVAFSLFYVNPLYADEISAKEAELYFSSLPEEAAIEQPLYGETECLTYEQGIVRIRQGMVGRETSFTVCMETPAYFDQSMLDTVMDAVMQETGVSTEGDYLAYQYRSVGTSGSYIQSGSIYKNTITFTFKYYTTAAEEAELTTKIGEIKASLALDGLSEYEKVSKIYEYMTANITYNDDAAQVLALPKGTTAYETGIETYRHAWTAYGAACLNSSVCQGYANLFYRLATEAGLSTRIIAGSSYGGGHAWNIVRVDGYYYNVDSTWDAGKTPAAYTYFLKSDSNFSNHTPYAQYTASDFKQKYVMADTNYSPSCKVSSVSFTMSTVSLPEGAAGQPLMVTVSPNNAANKTLTWTSSNPAVATVDSDGRVTAKSIGTTTITAVTTDGSDVSASCTVTVTHGTTEIVQTVPATCQTAGENAVVCSVCHAVLSRYTVAALGHRYVATVVRPTYDSEGYTAHTCSRCNDVYTDTPTAKLQYATEIVLNQTSASVFCGDTFTLSATVLPDNAADKRVVWYSKDTSVAVVDGNGLVTAVECGTADITAVAADGSGVYATCTVTVAEIENGWRFRFGTWYYIVNGVKQTGWQKIGGTWYYFDNAGRMQTGWIKDGGTWYYLNPDGDMAVGWIKDGGTWYYLKGSGAMATGWIYDGGAWYYLKGSGAMATGWIYDGAWYYLKGSGAMATGWVYDGGSWYYMYGSGAMATGRVRIGGRYYRFNASGQWI